MESDLHEIIDRLRSQQKALAEFGLHAFRATDLDDILQCATELVAEGLDVKLAKVLELMPDEDALLIRAGVNWKPGVVGKETFASGSESPAGYALQCDEPVVSPDLSRERRFALPQVLIEHGVQSMVNVVIPGEDEPFGVLEVDAPQQREFDEDDIAFLQTYANLLAAAVERHRTHRTLESGMREQKVLIQELEHRVKNMLGLVQSLAQQTIAEDAGARAFQEAFVGRLQALARAENLVFQDHAQELDLRRLVERSVEPFARRADAFELDGGSLLLPARIGRVLALVLHELGTNATKHGALAGPTGHVRISWAVDGTDDGREVRFRWVESDGAPVEPPKLEGFGTRLLTSLAGYELDGKAGIDHAPGGLRYELDFPLGER